MVFKVLGVLVVLYLVLIVVIGNKRNSRALSFSKIDKAITFPAGFLWGTATAAEQIEETPDSDWGAFIRDVIKNKKFETAGQGEAKPGHIHNLGSYSAEIIAKKTNHNAMFQEDVKSMADMNHNSYRFSFAWDRLFPRENMKTPDATAVKFYVNLIAELKKNKIKPSATLFHFSSPAWFFKEKDGKKGWERTDAIEHFSRFVKAVVDLFGKDITHWCTLNEPMVYIYNGYMQGFFPPNERRQKEIEVAKLASQLLKAHVAAYQIIKANDKKTGLKSEVGLTQHTRAFEPFRNHIVLDKFIAGQIEQAFIWDLTDAIATGVLKVTNTDYNETIPGLKGSSDYLGINYYGRFYVKFDTSEASKFKILMNDKNNPNEVINNLGWAHYPKGFTYTLQKAYEKYKLPIYVLENGTADNADDDQMRQNVLITHLAEMGKLMESGKADIRGYFHWSLIDNFEWAEGYDAKFGLLKVDYKNKYKRIRRKSADVFTEIIKNGISPMLYEKGSAPYQKRYL